MEKVKSNDNVIFAEIILGDNRVLYLSKYKPCSLIPSRYMYKAVGFGLTKHPFKLYQDLEGVK